MKKRRFIISMIGGMMMASLLSGCGIKNKQEVEQGFESMLAMYPTENLMDFYDMEGYRDEEFEEGDKGVWVLISGMAISQAEKAPLVSEGMVLRMNRNTRKAQGHYYIRIIPDDTKQETQEEQYPVTYDEQGIHLVEEVTDTALKEKIENFQFFVQYGAFQNLTQYENLRKMYNPEVPFYELEYQLTNDDPNVKQLRQRYDMPTDKAPTLLLKGRGDLEGSSIGYKNIEFTFDTEVDVFFSDSIDYQPTLAEDQE